MSPPMKMMRAFRGTSVASILSKEAVLRLERSVGFLLPYSLVEYMGPVFGSRYRYIALWLWRGA